MVRAGRFGVRRFGHVSLVTSAMAHVAIVLLAVVQWGGPKPLAATPPAVTVDIVSAKDVPELRNPELQIPELPPVLPAPTGDHSQLELPSQAPTGAQPPKQNQPKQNQPKQEKTKQERAKQEQAKSEQAKSEQAKPEQAKPEQAKPEQAKPEQAKPEQAKPEQAQQENPNPAAFAPHDPAAAPGAGTGETKPAIGPGWVEAVLQSQSQSGALTVGSVDLGTDPSEIRAKLEPDTVGEFKAHLDKCWAPVRASAEAARLRWVVRIALRPDGRLAVAPEELRIDGASESPGVAATFRALKKTVMRALQECQPYNFLPANKYKEWQILDLTFAPEGLQGG